MRLASTTANGYRDVTEEGPFLFGQSKDHRLDQLAGQSDVVDPCPLGNAGSDIGGFRGKALVFV